MNGSIEVDSAVGVGTRVAVSLPLQVPVAAPPALRWTLPWRRPALLCRAPEYHEWLTGLFDPDQSTITAASEMAEPPDPASHDFLIVTDEFAEANVLAWWRDPRKIVWATQAGPLVPARRRDGGVEVSVYSLSGLRAATRAAVDGIRGTAPDEAGAGACSAGLAQSSAPQSATGPATEAATGRDIPLTVLIAEDNLLNRNLLRDQLNTLGVQVVEATRGDDALARFDRQAVDAVFTDLNMPGMHGYDLLDRLRARQPSLPVFAISASARPEDIAQGRARGFTDYLTKPVALAALAAALHTARALQPRGTPLGNAPPGTPPRNGGAPPDEPRYAGPPDEAPPHTGQPRELPHDEPPEDEPQHEVDAKPDLPELPPAFVQAFQDQTRADLPELADIVAERSVGRLRQWLHRVSGGLSVLGASKLLDQCQQLREEAARAHGWNDDIEQASLAIGDVLEAMQSLAARHEDARR
jgi:two-component system capsular synthesis sensor histidine kinase RcsC